MAALARSSLIGFLLRSVLLGLIISGVLLLLVPDLRYGSNSALEWLSNPSRNTERATFNNAINLAGPAVVNIYSTSYDTRANLFRRQTYERTSLGSGVIMTDEGHILTCHHVVQNAESIQVHLQDGRTLSAQLIGFDIHTDLAVLKVEEENLPVIPQVSETNTKVGDLIMAIGNPLNLGQTITQGIVSATGRFGLANYTQFIQVDAALHEGNSGGALIDSNGVLLGINNSNLQILDINRRLIDVSGVSFAVPYELAKRVMDTIITEGKVTRSSLGMTGEEHVSGGIHVSSILANGPADRANIQVGDVLKQIDGQTIESASQMQDLIAETPPNTQINITLLRGDEVYQTIATLAELPSSLR